MVCRFQDPDTHARGAPLPCGHSLQSLACLSRVRFARLRRPLTACARSLHPRLREGSQRSGRHVARRWAEPHQVGERYKGYCGLVGLPGIVHAKGRLRPAPLFCKPTPGNPDYIRPTEGGRVRPTAHDDRGCPATADGKQRRSHAQGLCGLEEQGRGRRQGHRRGRDDH